MGITEQLLADLNIANKKIENLKCCGNCWWLYDDSEGICEKINDTNGYCDRWSYDKHTQDERKEY